MDSEPIEFDSSDRNPLTWIFDRKFIVDDYENLYLALMWVVTSAILFLPPLIFCAITQPTLTGSHADLTMPFLSDFGIYAPTLILTPLLLISTLKERRTLNRILIAYFAGPAHGADLKAESSRFRAHYKRHNPIIAIAAVVGGLLSTYMWAHKFLHDGIITWHTYGSSADSERFNAAGYICTACMVVTMSLLYFIALRAIVHFMAFVSIAKLSKPKPVVIPLHPDGCGGLSMISSIVKIYQPLVFVVGINIATVYANDIFLFHKNPFDPLNILTVIGFVLFCVGAFFLPLWPFNRLMREAKSRTMTQISAAFQELWHSEMEKVKQSKHSSIDYRAIRNVRTLYSIAGQMPVWPYDLKAVKSFSAYVIVPLLGIVASAIVQKLISAG